MLNISLILSEGKKLPLGFYSAFRSITPGLSCMDFSNHSIPVAEVCSTMYYSFFMRGFFVIGKPIKFVLIECS